MVRSLSLCAHLSLPRLQLNRGAAVDGHPEQRRQPWDHGLMTSEWGRDSGAERAAGVASPQLQTAEPSGPSHVAAEVLRIEHPPFVDSPSPREGGGYDGGAVGTWPSRELQRHRPLSQGAV